MTQSQHDKIIAFSSDGEFHCGNEYRANFIFSPHKRRSELEAKGWRFEVRPCKHGHARVKDYRMAKGEAKRVAYADLEAPDARGERVPWPRFRTTVDMRKVAMINAMPAMKPKEKREGILF